LWVFGWQTFSQVGAHEAFSQQPFSQQPLAFSQVFGQQAASQAFGQQAAFAHGSGQHFEASQPHGSTTQALASNRSLMLSNKSRIGVA
jgi:hypothetical protein